MSRPLTKLEKQGLTRCDRCNKIINGFGRQSYYDTVGSNDAKHKDWFYEYWHVCLKCGEKMFGWKVKP